MRPKNNQWYRVFHFSKKERNALFFFVPLLLMLWFIPTWWSRKPAEITIVHTSAEQPVNEIADTEEENVFVQPEPSVQHFAAPVIELRSFNPNTANKQTLLQLGLPERTVNTLINYRNRGGVFKEAADLKKIYGLRDEDYARIATYVNIPKGEKVSNIPPAKAEPQNKPIATTAGISVDIALAGAEDFKQLRGIGEVLSVRIVQFREKLGGFHSIDQMGEVYGLPDSVFQKIKPSLTLTSGAIQPININNCTVEDLKNHPYIKYNVANAVINYRMQHGVFNNLEDLLKIHLISDSLYKKLSPYLTY